MPSSTQRRTRIDPARQRFPFTRIVRSRKYQGCYKYEIEWAPTSVETHLVHCYEASFRLLVAATVSDVDSGKTIIYWHNSWHSANDFDQPYEIIKFWERYAAFYTSSGKGNG